MEPARTRSLAISATICALTLCVAMSTFLGCSRPAGNDPRAEPDQEQRASAETPDEAREMIHPLARARAELQTTFFYGAADPTPPGPPPTSELELAHYAAPNGPSPA